MSGPLANQLVGRARSIPVRPGLRLTTPLLIPSFSSKGFSFVKQTKRGRERSVSELGEVLTLIGASLTQSALFSAYDLYYDLLPDAASYLDKPEIVFLDSGGYEASNDFDEGQVLRPPYQHRKWSEKRLHKVVRKLPKHVHLVLVSHDTRGSLVTQAKRAHRFLSCYPDHVHNFLIKPRAKKDGSIDLDDVLRNIEHLRVFDIVGITEKELGSSLLTRLEGVNRLRRAMDTAEVKAPIHVFGSLDPLTVPLYFAAGAEVFDGLSWLRFFYHDGLSVYRDHAGVLSPSRGVQSRWDNVRGYALGENLATLRQLELDLRDFSVKGDYGVFGGRSAEIERGVRALNSKLHGGS